MAFEWQTGTNRYAGVGGNYRQDGDSGGSWIPGEIDYQNAAALIGTDAADALYGSWLYGTPSQGERLNRVNDWQGDGGIYYTDSSGNRYNENQIGVQYGDENGNGGYGYLPTTGFSSIGGIRGSSTAENAQLTKQLLQKYYPDATQAQLDTAAAQALSRRGRNYNEEDNPSTLVRAIGAELGGLSEQATTELAQLDPVWRERRDRIVEARNNSDDASSGVTGFLNDIGPLKYLALLAPGGAGLLGGATAISGAEQGDPLKMILGAAGAYYGMDTPGLFQPGGAVDKIGGLLGNNTVSLATDQVSALEPNMFDGIDDVGQLGYTNTGGYQWTPEAVTTVRPSYSDTFQTNTGQGLKYNFGDAHLPSMGGATATNFEIPGLGSVHNGVITPEMLAAGTGVGSTLPAIAGTGTAVLAPGAIANSTLTIPLANAAAGQGFNSLAGSSSLLNTKDALKLAQEGLKLAAGSTDQPEGLLGASSPGRQFSMLDVNYGFQPRSYGLLKG